MDRILIELISRYINHVICLHFCKFKEAGSKFRNTHVHFTRAESSPDSSGDDGGNDDVDVVVDEMVTLQRDNPENITGVGHDDEVFDDPSDLHHNTVSTLDSCEFREGPIEGRALTPEDLRAARWMTAWFHPAPERGCCAEGFFRIKCKCGDVCATFDMEAYDRWRESLD